MNRKDYQAAGYYFKTTVYRFLAVSTWIHRFEGEALYVDSRIAEKNDFNFIRNLKLLQKAATDVTLFEGIDYDASEAKDHFFSDRLRMIANSLWEEGRFVTYEEFQSKIGRDSNLDPVLEFFDDLKADEERLRWDRLVVFHLLLVAFVNTFGYKFQGTKEDDLARIARKIKHNKIRQNLVQWLDEYDLPGRSMKATRNVLKEELQRTATDRSTSP